MEHDWKTPGERLAGKKFGTAVAEYGERVMFVVRGPNRDRQCSFGLWLGFFARTQEVYLGTPDGVVRACTIKRIAEQDKWKTDDPAARGTTHQPDPRPESEEVQIRISAERPHEAVLVLPPYAPQLLGYSTSGGATSRSTHTRPAARVAPPPSGCRSHPKTHGGMQSNNHGHAPE